MSQSTTGAQDSSKNLPYIHCLRGYAVLLVITCHLTYTYPELPYPVHRLTTQGWYGVQLFFMASAITLMMSWHGEQDGKGKADAGAFFIRRFFRIAPAYYAGALLYYFVSPPVMAFDIFKLAPWLGFLNDWHPALEIEALGAWTVVPGGWSISAEFSFYMVFPIVASLVTTSRRAVWFLLFVCVGAAVVNTLAYDALTKRYSTEVLTNFMFFFVPNQAPVFALGILVYFGLVSLHSPRLAWLAAYVRAGRLVWLAVGITVVFSLAYVHAPMAVTLGSPSPSTAMVVSFGFALVIVALSVSPPGLLVNRWVAYIGKVSFSAYIIHFAVLDALAGPLAVYVGATNKGYAAIASFAAGWIGAVALTVAFSTLTYQLIENPGIAFGRRLIAIRRKRQLVRRDVLAASTRRGGGRPWTGHSRTEQSSVGPGA